MDKNSKEYESLQQKLKKLLALAERGEAGEAANTRRLLERLCAQYNVTLEELQEVKEQKYDFEIGRYKYMSTLFMQCYANVTGNKELTYQKLSRSRIRVKLTPLQYAELSSMFEWHKANFMEDLEQVQESIMEAYVHKHRIYRDRSNDKEDEEEESKPLSPADLRKALAALALQEQLGDRHYLKQLEEK